MIYGNVFLNEKYLFNEPDIYYNRDKFESGEINLCFITGQSGSGKSTMARSMSSKYNVTKIEMDDLIWNKVCFTLIEINNLSHMMYSFFVGPGAKYFYTNDDVKKGLAKEIPNYIENITKDFVDYAIRYAEFFQGERFVIEGIYIYRYIDPELLKDYAVYIKGTSSTVSSIRAAKRYYKNHKEEFKNFYDRIKKISKELFNTLKWDTITEKDVMKYRRFFKKLMKEQEKE